MTTTPNTEDRPAEGGGMGMTQRQVIDALESVADDYAMTAPLIPEHQRESWRRMSNRVRYEIGATVESLFAEVERLKAGKRDRFGKLFDYMRSFAPVSDSNDMDPLDEAICIFDSVYQRAQQIENATPAPEPVGQRDDVTQRQARQAIVAMDLAKFTNAAYDDDLRTVIRFIDAHPPQPVGDYNLYTSPMTQPVARDAVERAVWTKADEARAERLYWLWESDVRQVEVEYTITPKDYYIAGFRDALDKRRVSP